MPYQERSDGRSNHNNLLNTEGRVSLINFINCGCEGCEDTNCIDSIIIYVESGDTNSVDRFINDVGGNQQHHQCWDLYEVSKAASKTVLAKSHDKDTLVFSAGRPLSPAMGSQTLMASKIASSGTTVALLWASEIKSRAENTQPKNCGIRARSTEN